MSKTAKVICIITAIVLVLGVGATIAVMVASYDPENPAAGMYLDGERIKDPGVMLTIGQHQVSYDEYRYFYLTQKYYHSSGDPAYWNDDLEGAKAAELKEEVENNLRVMYAWLDLAAERGIGLTQEEKDQIVKDIQDEKKDYGTGFNARLKKNYLTSVELYQRITEMQTLVNKVQEEYTEAEKEHFEDEALKSVVTVKHILFTFDEAATDPEQNKQETLERANEILETYREQVEAEKQKLMQEEGLTELSNDQILEIEMKVFEKLRKKYNEDPGQGKEGYTFGEGTMVEEFYDASLELQVGQVSEPVETTYGYHIIMRLPLNEEYVEENKDALVGGQIDVLVKDMIEERANAYTIVPGPYYDKVAIATVK